MEPLLFLAHRIPFPPNKGDKIRSFHLLKYLAERYRVFLGTLIDDPADAEYIEDVKALCADAYFARIQPTISRLKSISGVLTGEALTLPYFRDQGLSRWVGDVIARERIRGCFVYSSAMAQYVLARQGMRIVVDFVDADSVKWTQYAERHAWPLSLIYRREGRRLLDFERQICRSADAAVFCTEEEAALFRTLAPECSDRVAVIRNGVDAEVFSPAHAFASPYASEERAIVFTGAMDYWPNVDGATWFAREVLPLVRREEPAARFYVVGMNPGPAMQALAKEGAIVVTGRVPDVRPYLRHACVAVAPLRVARGIQNKVLEAMAMARPTVVTPAPAASLRATPGVELAIASEPADFARAVLDLMRPDRGEAMGAAARRFVLASYSWRANLARLDALVGGTVSAGAAGSRLRVASTAAAGL